MLPSAIIFLPQTDVVGVPVLEVNIYPRNVVNVNNFINKLAFRPQTIKMFTGVNSINNFNCWSNSTAQKTTTHFFKFIYKKIFLGNSLLWFSWKPLKWNNIMMQWCPFQWAIVIAPFTYSPLSAKRLTDKMLPGTQIIPLPLKRFWPNIFLAL